MAFRVMGVKAGFQQLDLAVVSKAYKTSSHRLIVLDWGGTLVAENDKVDKLQAYAVAKGIATRYIYIYIYIYTYIYTYTYLHICI
jgi:hypothetical protein